MNIKKILALVLALVLVCSLAACGSTNTPATTSGKTPEGTKDSGKTTTGAQKTDDKVGVFWYTFSDTYLSSVRAAMNSAFDAAGVSYQDYDASSSQTTQTEQVQTALASGTTLLVVNLVDSSSDDAAQNIVNMAKEKNVPVIFFNRSVSESVVSSYDKCLFVGTDYEMAGHMQGKLVGEYLLDNYEALDLNGDGVISYVMFKGDEANMEAIARTQYGVEDADAVLTGAGKPALSFYDPNNTSKYLVDQNGNWSAAAAKDYMDLILAQYSEPNGNMVELVIANNDEMALGAISSLQEKGYNTAEEGSKTIPVFGVDATDSAKEAIAKGFMTGSIKQDAVGMAETIVLVAQNMLGGKDTLEGVDAENVVGTWRVNIPYAFYTGE